MSFDALELHPNILKGIHDLGYIRPTPIQKEAIPPILAGRDVIASAQTGTGKTAAFVLPILHRLLSERKKKGIRAMFIAPTRELALQSMEHLKDLSRYVPLKGHAIFGGVPMDPQIKALASGLDIISATPGRLLDHVYSGRIDFGALEVFVLDEADRMMDMGFLPDIQKIIRLLPPKRQNLIFSATIPPAIMELAREICSNPVSIQIGARSLPPAGIRHAVYPVPHHQKTEFLLRLLREGGEGMSSVLIFTRTKSRADRLAQVLDRSGFKISVLHSDRSQSQRLRALERFKYGRTQVLVATDIAARGLDIKDISHVINFDVPSTPEDYIHRIGRTARAEATGDAFSLIAPDEEGMIKEIEKVMHQSLPRVTLPDFRYDRGPAKSTPHHKRPHPHSHSPRSHQRGNTHSNWQRHQSHS